MWNARYVGGRKKFTEWRSSKGKFWQKSFSIPPSTSQVFDLLNGNLKSVRLLNGTAYSLRGHGLTDPTSLTPADWEAELPLQDIPWSQLAWVCSLGRPLDFIPTSHIQRVRLAFIHCLQAVIDSPNEDHLWKRVCLLPTILFIDIGKCRRADLDAKVELILGNCWPFKVGDFPGRMEKKVQAKDGRGQLAGAASTLDQVIGSIEDVDKRRMAYFKKLMTKGEVS
jgi:hypothetical protein